MTPNKIIERIDRMRPNAYTEEEKFKWVADLEGMVHRLVFQETEYTPLVYPDDADKELMIPDPFDDSYILYVEAMIDYSNREYGNYNNSAALFQSRFDEYRKAYIREHMPKSAGTYKM